MEKRLFLTIVVCAGILVFWYSVVAPPQPPPKKKDPPKPAETAQEKKSDTPPAPGPEQPPDEIQKHPDQPAHEKTLRNKGIEVLLTNRGAAVTSLRLLDYPAPREYEDAPAGHVELLPPLDPPRNHFALWDEQGGAEPFAVNWKVEEEGDNFVEYSYLHATGYEVRKRFELDSEKHLLRFTVKLANRTEEVRKIRLRIVPINGVMPDGPYHHEQFQQGFVAHRQGEVRSPEYAAAISLAGAKEPASWGVSALDWFGAKNRYFAAVFIPATDASHRILSRYLLEGLSKDAFERAGKVQSVVCTVQTGEITLGQDPHVYEYTLFAGPIRGDVLAEAPGDLTVLWNPYGFNFLADAILALLNFFFSIFGNYGVAILFTTLLIRVCLFPLSKKAQVSAFRMQELSPRIKVLKERYEKDPQKMNKEMWKIFREHGASPMSGCLPMFLQLPVFIAMFAVYNESIELRQAPFFLWIQDLSQPDRLIGPFERPVPLLLFSLWEINVLPVLMMITWFLQAYFAPKSPDPQMRTQQKIFMFMPLVFGLVCYSYAAGLSFYFFVNSLLAIAEQKIIKKVFLKPAPAG